MWSDHANLISLAYAGSGALKVEYTRTGKLTPAGQLEDGYKSVMRYLKNNFFDGTRQVSALYHFLMILGVTSLYVLF